jgi:hypothetical protein
MSYTEASGKSKKDLVSYQSVRGADIKAVYSGIKGLTPLKQLYHDFGRPTEDEGNSKTTVDNTVQFLHAIDLIERPTEDVVERIDDQPYEDSPFEMRVLHHLRQQSGEQRHFVDLHRVLVKGSRTFYEKSELMENGGRELDYALDWNVQKVATWYNLVEPMGLVSVRDNQQILTSPSPRLVYDLLSTFEQVENSTQLRDALDWVEQEFCYCYKSPGGAISEVHKGLSQTLSSMAEDGVLTLGSPSDAVREVALPTRSADTTSSFELTDRPDRPAYRYPLDAHQMETRQ